MNIPQRARELADKLTDNIECEISLVDEKGSARIVDVESLILAFAVEVERDALEAAAELMLHHNEDEDAHHHAMVVRIRVLGRKLRAIAIRALIITPTPERPDPTMALARLFRLLWERRSHLSPIDRMIDVDLAQVANSAGQCDLTPLGHEALRIAKENDHG